MIVGFELEGSDELVGMSDPSFGQDNGLVQFDPWLGDK